MSKPSLFPNILSISVLLSFIFAASGCATPAGAAEVVQSDLARDTSPAVPAGDLEALAAGNRAFALDFYQAVREQDGNLFFSPYSISAALAMTYAGARGDTETQMAGVLHFDLPQNQLHPAFNALDLQLTAQGDKRPAKDEPQPFQLDIANALWGQQGYSFLPEFLDLLAQSYGAGLRLLDFRADPDGARQQINDWISQQTQKKITDLIPEGGVNEMTRLVLANAIYFKADWLYPFEANSTRKAPFTTLDGRQVEVDMMASLHPETLPYLQGDGFQSVELPYAGDRISMLVLVPDAGGFADFESRLDAGMVEGVLSQAQPEMVTIRMPKFSFESSYSLRETLSGMGMPAAFDEADFSGMTGDRDLSIGDVFHKAFVAVDEKGTEAAAATVVEMATSALIEAKVLTIDRPFIFFLIDQPTGTVMFLGRVLEPNN